MDGTLDGGINSLNELAVFVCTYQVQCLLKVSQFRKSFWGFSILPKRTKKNSAIIGQGKNYHFIVSFLGELKTLRFPFESN